VGCDVASFGDSLHVVLSFSWVMWSSVILLGLLDSEDEGTIFHWNIGSSLCTDVASHCRRTEFIVGIVTRLLAGQSGARIPVRVRDFFFSKISTPAVGLIQSPIEWVLALKRLEREVNHSASSNADV